MASPVQPVRQRQGGRGPLRPGERFILTLSAALLFVFAVLFLLGMFHKLNIWQTTKVETVRGAAANAGYAYVTAHGCQNCHMILGIGDYGGPLLPVLDGIGSKHTPQWLNRFFKDPASVIPHTYHNGQYATAFRHLTPTQRHDLVAFFSQLKCLPGSSCSPTPPPG